MWQIPRHRCRLFHNNTRFHISPFNVWFFFVRSQIVAMAAPSSSQLTNDLFYTVYKTYNGKLRVPTIGFCPASWEKNSVLSYPKHRIGTNQKLAKIMHTQFEQMLRSFDGPANRPDIFWEQCECKVYHASVATYADAQSHVKTLLAQEDTSTAGSASDVDYNAAGGRPKRRCTDSLATAAAKKNIDVMITVCNFGTCY